MDRFKPVRIAGICAGLVMVVAGMLGFSASAYAETVTFKSIGKEQEFKVPAGVTSVSVQAVGSEGGRATGKGGTEGLGTVVSGDLAVTPGEVLYVEVGGVPFNGGGEAEDFEGVAGGDGGGASDVRTVSIGKEKPRGQRIP